jgi:hypothetical protein
MSLLVKLNNKHDDYLTGLRRWHFQYASYLGGDIYKKGEYLRKYWGENDAPYDAYAARLDVTPLDNHVKTTVDIYRSYIWRNPPVRQLSGLFANPFAQKFLANADYSGAGLDSFLKTAMDWAMVLGYVWIGVDRPAAQSESAGAEIANDIYAYTTMYTPQMVTDWGYERSGPFKELTFLKVLESQTGDTHTIRCWYPDYVEVSVVRYDSETAEYSEVLSTEIMPNNLGKIPFFPLIPQASPGAGLGVSILADVADMQRSIYNKLSELEQTIRLSCHPMLAKTRSTGAQAGAGGIVTLPDDLDPGLFPQLLQPSGSVESILLAIESDVNAINAMTHLSAVRAVKGSSQSGVALQTERQLLNSKLSDLADIIEEAEMSVWNLWFDWMDITAPAEFKIEYSRSFDTRDTSYELQVIEKAKSMSTNPDFIQWCEIEIAKLVISDEAELNVILQSISTT